MHQYQSFVELIWNAQQRDWTVAFWGGGVLPRLWYGFHLCFPPDRWDMFVRVHSLRMSRSQYLALLPLCCSISVSRSSKPAAFPGFNRLRPVARSSRLKGLVSSGGGWLLLGTIVFWCSPGGLRCSTLLPLDNCWLAIWSAVTVVTTGGDTLSAPRRRMVAHAFFAIHGEVGVFHYVSQDITSFIRDFIQ